MPSAALAARRGDPRARLRGHAPGAPGSRAGACRRRLHRDRARLARVSGSAAQRRSDRHARTPARDRRRRDSRGPAAPARADRYLDGRPRHGACGSPSCRGWQAGSVSIRSTRRDPARGLPRGSARPPSCCSPSLRSAISTAAVAQLREPRPDCCDRPWFKARRTATSRVRPTACVARRAVAARTPRSRSCERKRCGRWRRCCTPPISGRRASRRSSATDVPLTQGHAATESALRRIQRGGRLVRTRSRQRQPTRIAVIPACSSVPI